MADGLFRRFVWSRLHFPEIEMRFLNSLAACSVDIAIDVGAALGSYTWILNRKSAQVFAFEPGAQHARCLARSIFGSRVTLVQAAVGRSCDTVSMYTPGSDTNALHSATLSPNNPVIENRATEVRQVEQVSLDWFFLDKIDVGRTIDVLKVDVEGYELEVFAGAQALIKRHHPLIICEIEKRHNADYSKIFGTLRTAGYRTYIFREKCFVPFDSDVLDSLQSAETLKIRLSGNYVPGESPYINNFIFQHAQSRIKVTP
jgi:FkbM family methyltransferase